MRRALAACAACLCAAAGAWAAPTEGVDRALTRVFAIGVAQGLAGEVLIGDRDTVWFERAAGLAQRAPDRPHRVGAVWRWASVSKQLAAVLAMQQVDAGKLALDAPIVTAWPAFASPSAKAVTTRQLLQHLSGLPNPDDSPAAGDGMPAFYRRPLAGLQADSLRYCSGPPKRAAGEAFDYNNCDTLVIGALLTHITGLPYAQLLRQQIGKPLGLKSLRMDEGRSVARAQAFELSGKPVAQPVVATFGAAGALEGTARDLLAFDRALIARRLVSPASSEVMWTGERRWGYAALGAWSFPAQLKGCKAPVRLIERRGDVGGIQVRNIIAPEAGLSFIVFSNTADFEFGEIWQGRGFSHDLLAAALCTAPD